MVKFIKVTYVDINGMKTPMIINIDRIDYVRCSGEDNATFVVNNHEIFTTDSYKEIMKFLSANSISSNDYDVKCSTAHRL